jgi:hypothetical protein
LADARVPTSIIVNRSGPIVVIGGALDRKVLDAFRRTTAESPATAATLR